MEIAAKMRITCAVIVARQRAVVIAKDFPIMNSALVIGCEKTRGRVRFSRSPLMASTARIRAPNTVAKVTHMPEL